MYLLSYSSVFLKAYGSEVSLFWFELYSIWPSLESKFYTLAGFLECFCGSYNFFFGLSSFLLDFLLEDTCYLWVWTSYCLLISLASLSFFLTKLFLKSLILLKASLLDSSSSDNEEWF